MKEIHNNGVTHEEVLQRLEYRDGGLYWIKPTASQIKVGTRAGRIDTHGYRQITLFGKAYFEHRLNWFYHYGVWPVLQLDHINGDRLDNRIENLREVSNQQNQFNRKSTSNSSSQYKGVSWYKPYNKWLSSYTLNGKKHYIGYFDNEIAAAKAYDDAVKEHQTQYKMENFNG